MYLITQFNDGCLPNYNMHSAAPISKMKSIRKKQFAFLYLSECTKDNRI